MQFYTMNSGGNWHTKRHKNGQHFFDIPQRYIPDNNPLASNDFCQLWFRIFFLVCYKMKKSLIFSNVYEINHVLDRNRHHIHNWALGVEIILNLSYRGRSMHCNELFETILHAYTYITTQNRMLAKWFYPDNTQNKTYLVKSNHIMFL